VNLIVWILLGALLGFEAGRITKAKPRDLFNVEIGVLGAVLGGEVLSPLFGFGTFYRDDFDIPALLVSLIVAVMMLVIVNLAREERKLKSSRRRSRYRHSTDPSRHLKA
jgi:uncharacterized membrane protein YeaQ/YmgE (transglycosylase-associated protein family)